MQEELIVRQMQPGDLEQALQLSISEGWNQTINDWDFILQGNTNTCLVAEYEGQVIGTTTVIDYTQKLGWVGMVLVNRHFRKRGVANSLLAAAIERSKSIPTLGLDATPAGAQVYDKLDFLDEYTVVRMTTNSLRIPLVRIGAPVIKLDMTLIDQIVALDATAFGAERRELLTYLATQFKNMGYMVKKDGKVKGFALGRDGYRFRHVGPVIAHTFEDARSLIYSALSKMENKPVVIDVLSDKVELREMLKEAGFVEQRQFIRMYRGPKSSAARNDYWCLAGPEYG